MAEWRLYKIARRAAIPRSVLCLLELLRELVPTASDIAVLFNPTRSNAEAELRDLAPPPGLSRLQRERAEKKQRKALRAA
jgi:hypothetical protein